VYGEGQLKALCDFYSEVLNWPQCNVDYLKETEWPARKVRKDVQEFYHRIFSNPNQKETLKISLSW
jgi:hypothetical protein